MKSSETSYEIADYNPASVQSNLPPPQIKVKELVSPLDAIARALEYVPYHPADRMTIDTARDILLHHHIGIEGYNYAANSMEPIYAVAHLTGNTRCNMNDVLCE